MGKRSTFERRKNDLYETPYDAVLPLLPHLPVVTTFYEPCVGECALVKHLETHGHDCIGCSDLDSDATTCQYAGDFTYFITNPPWTRELLHPIIVNLSNQRQTWLLFDADWMHTKQARPYLPRCQKIVAVGRVKWIPDSLYVGKDNACWYLFGREETQTQFIGK